MAEWTSTTPAAGALKAPSSTHAQHRIRYARQLLTRIKTKRPEANASGLLLLLIKIEGAYLALAVTFVATAFFFTTAVFLTAAAFTAPSLP